MTDGCTDARRGSGPPASPPGSSPAGTSTSPWSSTTARRTRPRACSPATRSRPRRCCGRSRCSPTGRLRAVVLNSGGANACTGPEGFQTAHATAEKAAELLGCGPLEVAVCSTGLIGEAAARGTAVLAGVEAAAKALGDDAAPALAAATAIMTTDTVAKQAAHADAPAGASAASPRAPA